MKKTGLALQITAGIVSAMLLVTSCTMQKRIYRPGYHIEWVNGKHLPDKQTANTDTKMIKENKTVTTEQSETTTNTVDNSFANTVTDNNITASVDNNPIVLSSNKPVSFHKTVTSVNKNPTIETKTIVKQETKKSKANKSNRPGGSGKSQLIALLLCIFVGALGIHRFYLGYIGIGIIQLLTLGGCGIWALVDLIMIITGDLKPKDGDYEKKL